MKLRDSQRGSLLIEIILVTFLFAVIGTGMLSTLITSTTASKQGTEHVVVSGYIKEAIEAVRSIRDQQWSDVTNGTHGLTTTGSKYALSGSSDALDGGYYTRTTTIEDVYRDGSGNIAASGTLDSKSKKVTVNITWDLLTGNTQSVDAVFYVFDWSVAASTWLQDVTGDWTAGEQNSTSLAATGDGEIILATTDADWDGATVRYEIDLSGSGNRIASYLDDVYDIYFSLADNTSGDDFEAYDVADIDSTTPTKIDGYDVSNANDFATAQGHAFIATDASTEIEIVSLTSYTQVATIDLTGGSNANTITANGTTLVIGRDSSGEDELWIYDISTPTSPSFQYSTNVSADLNDLAMNATHVFAATDNNGQEIYAFQLSDGAQIDSLDLSGNDDANSLELVGNNLYVARDDGSTYDFQVVDVTTPSSMSENTSLRLEVGDDVNDVDIDADEAYAALATDNNSEEVWVVDLSTFTQEQAIDATGNENGTAIEIFAGYIYLGSTANSEDLMIINVASNGWSSPTLTGSSDLTGNHNAFNIYVSGNYAHVVRDANGTYSEYYIYDISTPSSPTYIADVEIGADVNDIVVSGNYAYLATDDNSRELDIWDISTISSPTRIGSVDAPGNENAETVVLNGTTAYIGRVSSSNDEFIAIHTLNPGGWSYPEELATMDDSDGSDNALEIYTSGDYAYVVTQNGGDELFIFDVSTPGSPSLTGTFNVGSQVRDVYVSGDYAYLATDHNSRELDVIDVSTKSSPSRAGSYNLSGNTNAFTVTGSGNYVYLGRDGSSNNEFNIFDVSTPSSPSLSGSANFSNADINKLAVDGDYVYAATDDNSYELAVFDVSTKSSPSHIGGYNASGNTNGQAVSVSGNIVVLGRDSSGSDEIEIIDISSSKSSPTQHAGIEIGGRVNDLHLSGSSLYVAGDLNNTEFEVWDLTSPASPTETGVLDLDADANGIFFNGTHVFLATEHNTEELMILKAADAATTPDSPVIAGSADAGARINELCYDDNYVYAASNANSQELQVWDVSTASSPSLSTSYNASGGADGLAIDCYDTVLALGRDQSGNDEVLIFDISTAGSPSYQGGDDTDDAVRDLSLADTSTLFMANDDNDQEFQVWDISSMSNPTQSGTYDLNADANGVFFNGTNAFLATEHNSLELQIFEEGSGPSEYTRRGNFTSQAFDTGASSSFSTISWTESGTGDVEFRIRTADTEANLDSAQWVGSDGTGATTYSTSGTSITTDPSASGTQWVQFKAYLSGDTTATVTLEDVSVTYN